MFDNLFYNKYGQFTTKGNQNTRKTVGNIHEIQNKAECYRRNITIELQCSYLYQK